VQQEEKRAVVDARQTRPEAAVEAKLIVLLLDELLLRLPFDLKRRSTMSKLVVTGCPAFAGHDKHSIHLFCVVA
jgi:hypothetical protein